MKGLHTAKGDDFTVQSQTHGLLRFVFKHQLENAPVRTTSWLLSLSRAYHRSVVQSVLIVVQTQENTELRYSYQTREWIWTIRLLYWPGTKQRTLLEHGRLKVNLTALEWEWREHALLLLLIYSIITRCNYLLTGINRQGEDNKMGEADMHLY